MALYVSIDESYSVRKLSSLKQVVKECSPYTLQDGTPVTKNVAIKQLEQVSFNLYDYDEDQLEEAKEKGYASGVDWILKIQTI